MQKHLFNLGLIFFSLFEGCSEASSPIQQETVDYLKPKLNSDRIEYFFGSFAVDVLDIHSPAFPGSRISNLYSTNNGKKIMRTLAVVDFFQPTSPELLNAHCEIMEGKAIGIALRDHGWSINKKPLYFGSIILSPAVMDWMDELLDNQGALHIYRLDVSKKDQSETIPYCTIIEVQSPQYLSIEWLQALYPDQYKSFSNQTDEVGALLSRLKILLQTFPLPRERK
ncbi:MAG TPA: hypothetical protein VGP47_00825 [Parachlamydiaceae bacterium]|nr:hypothetical protein [Parachlamydiaceae bacterium]